MSITASYCLLLIQYKLDLALWCCQRSLPIVGCSFILEEQIRPVNWPNSPAIPTNQYAIMKMLPKEYILCPDLLFPTSCLKSTLTCVHLHPAYSYSIINMSSVLYPCTVVRPRCPLSLDPIAPSQLQHTMPVNASMPVKIKGEPHQKLIASVDTLGKFGEGYLKKLRQRGW